MRSHVKLAHLLMARRQYGQACAHLMLASDSGNAEATYLLATFAEKKAAKWVE